MEFKEVEDYENGKQRVNESDAFGIININGDEFSYYRSPYNEPEGGKLIRGIFEESIGRSESSDISQCQTQMIPRAPINSNAYFTFAELPIIMMFIALMIGHSVTDERTFGTIRRIKISKMGISTMLISKVIPGLCVGVLQIATAYILSNVFLNV